MLTVGTTEMPISYQVPMLYMPIKNLNNAQIYVLETKLDNIL